MAAIFVLNGCGGAGLVSGTILTALVRFSIDWALRGRALTGPSSALSATLTLSNADPAGHDFTFTVNRETAPAAYTGSYTTTGTAKVGTWPMTVRFYAQPDGAGAVVGIAQSTATVQQTATNVGEITTMSSIGSVEVAAGQVVPLGANQDITFTARDSAGAIVAVTPGSALFGTSNAAILQIVNGQGKGLAIGFSGVTATVDGKVSPPVQVEVSAAGTPEFTVTDLGSLGGTDTLARAINNNGQIVGRATLVGGASRPFLWQNGVMTELPILQGALIPASQTQDSAHDINDAGVIVGNSGMSVGSNTQLALWQNGTVTAIGVTSQLNYAGRITPARINQSGQVAFKTEETGTDSSTEGVFVWLNGVTTPVKTAVGSVSGQQTAINDLGDVAFTYHDSTLFQAPTLANLWHTGTLTQLDSSSPARVFGMNSVGQVVGDLGSHAVIWQIGARTDLSSLQGLSQARANAINSHGAAVGICYSVNFGGAVTASRAALWRSGAAIDIRTLIPPGTIPDGDTEAVNINNAGQVLVVLNPQGGPGRRSFLLTPK